jgi:hypothetical protein
MIGPSFVVRFPHGLPRVLLQYTCRRQGAQTTCQQAQSQPLVLVRSLQYFLPLGGQTQRTSRSFLTTRKQTLASLPHRTQHCYRVGELTFLSSFAQTSKAPHLAVCAFRV